MNSEEIKVQAKKIMDDFMSAMKDVEVEEGFDLERNDYLREDGEGKDVDLDFRERFIANAPKSSSYAILANKGKWVEK